MIVTRLRGGLGNQLFQYAAGRRLALVHNTELFLDISGLDVSVRMERHYELRPFNIAARIADDKILSRIGGLRNKGLAKYITGPFRRHIPLLFLREVKEKYFQFDPEILTLPDDIYLSGYWQSERYFSDVADMIRHDCTITDDIKGKNLTMLGDITTCSAVSVHIRRGDYLTDPEVLARHGVCDLDYYVNAANYISERVNRPVFIVFSDDIGWVRANLKLPFPVTIVDHNGPEHAVEDLRLMVACRHHIIANSTFSWWGAWLNPQPEKIVVAPERWFNDYDADTRDLYPSGWVRL